MGEDNGRDTRGLFAAGNKFSRGNLGNMRMKQLRRALLDCATPERVAAVEKTLYEAAVGGDIAAIKVWLEHMIGRPPQALEVSGPDGRAPGVEIFMAAVLAALEPYPSAKLAVAARLKGVGRDRGDGPND
jgi:hypothetical protein